MKVVKLGGSVIAPKHTPLSADTHAIYRLAEELRRYLSRSEGKLVVVHGGGSFGHYLVRECLNAEGFLGVECFSRVANYMMVLNTLVVDALLSSGISAVSVPPRSICSFRDEVPECFMGSVREMIEGGATPVLFGDVVASSGSPRFRVISGDVIAWELVRELGAGEVIFATDVNGIYTSDPKRDPSARLLREVRAEEVLREAVEGEVTSSVTGGILEKVRVALGLGIRGVRASVINGLVPGNLYNALTGRVEGTVIWF